MFARVQFQAGAISRHVIDAFSLFAALQQQADGKRSARIVNREREMAGASLTERRGRDGHAIRDEDNGDRANDHHA